MGINEAVNNIAAQMGSFNVMTSLLEDEMIRCMGVHQLKLSSAGKIVTTLVYKSDLEGIEKDRICDRLETRIRVAVARLQSQMHMQVG